MDKKYVNNKCPFCNYSIIKYFNLNWRNILKKPSFENNRQNIFYCKKCTNAWTIPKPGNIDYYSNDFHENLNIQSIDDLPRQWRKAIKMQVNIISNNVNNNAKIVEIGCGKGLLLNELKNVPFDVTGIEISKSACKYLKTKGVNVYNAEFPSFEIDNKYDLVIASHVLEHVENTDEFIKKVKEILKIDGYVLFIQTNWKGLMPRLKRGSWYGWVMEQHYWHFTTMGMINYLEKYNFELKKLEYTSLEHNNSLLSVLGEFIPGFGDQFHLLMKLKS